MNRDLIGKINWIKVRIQNDGSIGADSCLVTGASCSRTVTTNEIPEYLRIKIQLFYYDRVWECKENAIAIGS